MTATMIDLDDEALEKAKQYYGTTTKKETVNRALRDAAARLDERRTAFARHLEEAFLEFEQMSEEERADLYRRMETTDHKLAAQLAEVEAARTRSGRSAA